MGGSVYASLFSTFDNALTQYISQTAANLAQALAPAVQIAATLYIVFKGYMMLTGKSRELMSVVVWDVIRLVVIVALVTNVGMFDQYVTQLLFVGVPVEIANAIGGGATTSSAAGLMDTILNSGTADGVAIWKSAGMTNMGAWFYGLLPIIGAALCSALGETMILGARVALALILALGPLFIGFALFEPTRGWFRAWLNTAVDFVLLQVLTVALAALLVQSATFAATGANANGLGATTAQGAIAITALYLVGFLLFARLPSISSGLSSGAGLQGVIGSGFGRRPRLPSAAAQKEATRAGTREGISDVLGSGAPTTGAVGSQP